MKEAGTQGRGFGPERSGKIFELLAVISCKRRRELFTKVGFLLIVLNLQLLLTVLIHLCHQRDSAKAYKPKLP
jgi:hypothetical protein